MTQRQDDIKATPLWPHQFPGGLPRQPPVSPADARSCQAISQLVGKSDHVTHLRETRQGLPCFQISPDSSMRRTGTTIWPLPASPDSTLTPSVTLNHVCSPRQPHSCSLSSLPALLLEQCPTLLTWQTPTHHLRIHLLPEATSEPHCLPPCAVHGSPRRGGHFNS